MNEVVVRAVSDGQPADLLHLQLVQSAFKKGIDRYIHGYQKERDPGILKERDGGKKHDHDVSGQKRKGGKKSVYTTGISGIDSGPGISQLIECLFILRGLITKLHALFADTGFQMAVQALIIDLFQMKTDKAGEGVQYKVRDHHDSCDPDDLSDSAVSRDLIDHHLRRKHLNNGLGNHREDQDGIKNVKALFKVFHCLEKVADRAGLFL